MRVSKKAGAMHSAEKTVKYRFREEKRPCEVGQWSGKNTHVFLKRNGDRQNANNPRLYVDGLDKSFFGPTKGSGPLNPSELFKKSFVFL